MDVNKKARRQRRAEQKLRIVEEGRQTGHTVSEVSQRYQINLKQFYDWERQAKRGALAGLRQGNRTIKPDDGRPTARTGDDASAGSACGTGSKKGLGIAAGRHDSRDEQQRIVADIATAKQRGRLTVDG